MDAGAKPETHGDFLRQLREVGLHPYVRVLDPRAQCEQLQESLRVLARGPLDGRSSMRLLIVGRTG